MLAIRTRVLFGLLLFAANIPLSELALAQEQEPVIVKKPSVYTGLAFVGYQGGGIASDFSTIAYRTSATGMMLSYTRRFWGVNLNAARVFAFREWLFKADAVVLVNWAEVGINIPLLRHWGDSFFGKYSLLLSANTSLFKRLYVQPHVESGYATSQYIHDKFPQIYDFGLEWRGNLINFKLGYLLQPRQYTARQPQFSMVPEDLSGAYFELAVGLGFWFKREEVRIPRSPKPTLISAELEELMPEVRATVQFVEPSGNNKLDGGESGTLQIELKNAGKGFAKGIQVRLREFYQQNEHLTFSRNVPVADLVANSSSPLYLPITADREIQNGEIELEVEIDGRNFSTIIKKVKFEVEEYDPTDEPRKTRLQNPNAIAVVIGIRNYQKAQIPSVDHATHDAQVMREYLVKTLGFRPSNILPRDPNELMTAGNLKTLVKNRLPTYLQEGETEVFFYYAGHGAPNTNTNEPFLVPYDGDPNYLTPDNAYRLSDLYYDLANLKARHITLVLDACFSGFSGDGTAIIKSMSPVNIKVINPLLSHPNVTIFASSQIDQVSNWYPEKKHGLFTYFFLRGLRGKADANGDRRITVGELKDYVQDESAGVPYWSNREFQRRQEPVVYASDVEKVIVNYEGGAEKW